MKQILLTILVACVTLFSTNQAQAQCYTAVQLDGVNDYMHTPFANYSFTNFTIEMWINSANYLANDHYVSLNRGSVLILGGWAADGSFNTWADGLSPNTTNSGAGTTPAANSWHHVAFVYDGTNQIVYIDGIVASSVASSGSVNQSNGLTYGFSIGAKFDGSQQHSNTTFEDVRIWQIAKSQSQLVADWTTDLTGSEIGLVAYYRFEDGPGSSTVTDLTGNGNNLTMMNMDPATDWVSGLFSVNPESTDTQNSCGPYTWVDGITYTSNNNTAQYTYVGGAAGGCDSIVTLNLTVNAPADSTVTTVDSIITSNAVGVDYLWLDCDDNFAPIPGETNQSFTASETGNYAVVVTAPNGCRDTSECVAISFIALNEASLENGITMAPNPTNGSFSISTLNYSGQVAIKVTDVTGKIIFSSTENLGSNSPINIDLSKAANGMYFVTISDVNESHSMRVLKK